MPEAARLRPASLLRVRLGFGSFLSSFDHRPAVRAEILAQRVAARDR